MNQTVEARRVEERVALTALFFGFLKVSLLGFGGGLVWARRIVVDQRRWLNDHEFAEILTLCQFMPGPNIVGITLCSGSKLRGPLGAVSAVAGFILIPWTVGLAFGSLCLQYAQLPILQNIPWARDPGDGNADRSQAEQDHEPKGPMKDPTASLVLAAHLALLSSISFGGFPTV